MASIGYHKKRTHPQRVGAAYKQSLAMRLRIKGYSFDEIGKRVAPNATTPASSAQTLITRGLNSVRVESAEELRKLELARLDYLLQLGYETAEQCVKRRDARGVTAAINAIVRVCDRRAKLMGLDAPVKYDLLLSEAREMAKHLGISENDFMMEVDKVAQEAWKLAS